MASYGRHQLALISAGFYEFAHTTTDYISKAPVLHRIGVAVSVIISSILIAIYRPRTKRMEVVLGSRESVLQKVKKFRLVKMSLGAVAHLLGAVEYLVTPSKTQTKESPKPKPDPQALDGTEGLPKLLNLRHMSTSTAGETPIHKRSESEEWTPFSSVSSVDNPFDRSCVSLMEDLSQSTVATPVRDIRQQMASKIRTWRLAIKDLEGTPEFPTWSPDPRAKKEQTWLSRMWSSMKSWIPFGNTNPSVPGSAQRKRKRLDGDEDDADLALYIPHHKDQPKMNGHAVKAVSESPSIRGLSVVPIIGNWFSAENDQQPNQNESRTDTKEGQQLDHIALVQRDFLSPGRKQNRPKEVNCDTDSYEILDLDANRAVDDSADRWSQQSGSPSSERTSASDSDME